MLKMQYKSIPECVDSSTVKSTSCPSEGLSSVPSNFDRDPKIFFNTPVPGPRILLPHHWYIIGSIQREYLHVDTCACTYLK